jgi:hypothetical protein
VPNSVELIPVSEQDESIFAAWESGEGLRSLARKFGLSVMNVEQALDRMLPAFDAQHQLRAFKRELRRLEDLSGEFYTIAKRDLVSRTAEARDSVHLICRINERIAAMRGWSPVNVRMDLHTVQAAEQPKSFEKIREAVYRVARGPDWRPDDGNGAPRESDGAVTVLSPSGDDKTSN